MYLSLLTTGRFHRGILSPRVGSLALRACSGSRCSDTFLWKESRGNTMLGFTTIPGNYRASCSKRLMIFQDLPPGEVLEYTFLCLDREEVETPQLSYPLCAAKIFEWPLTTWSVRCTDRIRRLSVLIAVNLLLLRVQSTAVFNDYKGQSERSTLCFVVV